MFAHARGRELAEQVLRNGVFETSVRAAAGWSSGAMVARYTHAVSGELAIDEFQRSWGSVGQVPNLITYETDSPNDWIL